MARLFFCRKRFVPIEGEDKDQKGILFLLLVSLLFFVSVKVIPFAGVKRLKSQMLNASNIMVKAINTLKQCRSDEEIPIDKENDPNQTGLIGIRYSRLTTSLGHLEAKRTTTNPEFAALVVYLLEKAGVRTGETVAVGASSSFPSLIVAVLSAAKAKRLKLLLIVSLGASQWGANRLDFHWLRMHECLEKGGVFGVEPIAMSLGGDRDKGEEMEEEVRSQLRSEVEKKGFFFIDEPDLAKNVSLRMILYDEKADGDPIKAFINIGGSWSNIGTDAAVLRLEPGLTKSGHIPLPEDGGVIHMMAAKNIPVIHLLNIRGLVGRYGLPWDPVPLTQPGEGRVYMRARETHPLFMILAGGYLFFVIVFITWRGAKKKLSRIPV